MSNALLAKGTGVWHFVSALVPRARFPEEPAAVIPHAGICEGGTGQPVSLPQSTKEMKRLLSCFLLVTILASCDPKSQHTAPALESPLTLAAINTQLVGLKGWEWRFESCRGKWYGMDSDSSIVFLPGGRVTVTECGYAVQTYDGLYSVDDKGAISVDLARYNSKWPPMVLRREGDEFLLFRQDDDAAFLMGDRGAATTTSEMKPFWPFALTASSWAPPKEPKLACLCCGFVTLEHEYSGTCLVCFWANDQFRGDSKVPLDLDQESLGNGRLTLRQARKNFQEVGASDPTMKKYVLNEADRAAYKLGKPAAQELDQPADGKPPEATQSPE